MDSTDYTALIDPIESLSFSVQSNPKVYALLLGSGLSRAAQIPTGWEIVRDLVRKLATIKGDTVGPDVEQWYSAKYGEQPDYSRLIQEVSKTPHERQRLLRPYFEPNEQQRLDGQKAPTTAHKSIARLVATGFIKVIVTTNFDRLIENALEDEGIAPTVLSSEEQIQGAPPLDHIDCCVYKVHGDYRDPQIRNTTAELAAYPSAHNTLLSRIFDDYGLIVCGWSADWDTALRNAMYRAQSRRYTTYWALHGDATDEAKRLIHHRRAHVISIDSADSLFQSLQQMIESLAQFSRPHPLSTEAAIASLKRLLSRPQDAIQLQDLVDSTVDQALAATTGEHFKPGTPEATKSALTDRLFRYESACVTILSMGAIGGYWLNEHNFVVWQRAADRLARMSPINGGYYPIWNHLRYYPGILFLYALGLGAVERNEFRFLNEIFVTRTTDIANGDPQSSTILEVFLKHRDPDDQWKNRVEGLDNRPVTASDHIGHAIRACLRRLIPSDEKFEYVFDKFEMLAAMAFARKQSYLWFPLGSYVWRGSNRRRILEEISNSISTLSSNSPFVANGLIGDTADEGLEWINQFRETTNKTAVGMRIRPF